MKVIALGKSDIPRVPRPVEMINFIYNPRRNQRLTASHWTLVSKLFRSCERPPYMAISGRLPDRPRQNQEI